MKRLYSPAEDAVLSEYLHKQVRCWDSVVRRLDRRSRHSAEKRLGKLRRDAGSLWKIPPGGDFSWREAA